MASDDATLQKYTRKHERVEDDAKKAEEGMRDAIKSAMQDPQTHLNIIRERQIAKEGSSPIKNRAAWGDDGDEFTGIDDERPWLRE